MLMQSLEAYGVPTQLIDIWRTEYGDTLLPVQQQAVQHCGVLSGKRVVICAPTSSGKTLVGEMAAVRAAMEGRRALYLVPTKALAEAKYALFRHLYEPLGLRVRICTRDRRADEESVRRGEFDLVVAIPEKIRAMFDRPAGHSLRSSGSGSALPSLFASVIADELQLVTDPQRGPCLELLLSRLAADSGVQIVGLSASLGTDRSIAEWLGAQWLQLEARPVELRKGVLIGDEFRYVEHNSGSAGVETWENADVADASSLLDALCIIALALADEPTLVFVRDRRSAIELATRLVEAMTQYDEAQTVAELRGLPQTYIRRRLAELALYGVAFHSTDLQFAERQAIEAGFLRGDIRVLCCTSTLALGLNLPARNVLVDPFLWHRRDGLGRSSFSVQPLTRAEFDNRAGRAGRLGWSDEFGRAIVPADSELRAAALMRRYVLAPDARVHDSDRPGPPDYAPSHRLMQLAAVFGTCTESDLAIAWSRTYGAGFLRGASSAERVPQELIDAADECRHLGLLADSPEGFSATALGRIFGTSDLCLASFTWLVRGVKTAGNHCKAVGEPPHPWHAALLCALTAEAADGIYLPASTGDHRDCCAELLATACEQSGTSSQVAECLADILADQAIPVARRSAAAALVLALLRWIGPEPAAELEEALHIPAARLAHAAETIAWLVDITARIAAELGGKAAEHSLAAFARRLCGGIEAEALPLYDLQVSGLDRDLMQALLGAGYASPAAVLKAGPDGLAELIPPLLARRLYHAAQRRLSADGLSRRHTAPLDEPAFVHPPACGGGPALLIYTARPHEASFCGRKVPLRPAEFRMLKTLAEKPGQCVQYEELYSTMWGEEQFAYPGQLYSHRSRLASKLRKAAAETQADTPDDLLVTIRTHGIMLNLPADQVAVK